MKHFLFGAALACALGTVVNPARADLAVLAWEDNDTPTRMANRSGSPIDDLNLGKPTITLADYTIKFIFATESQTPDLSQLLASETSIKRTTAGGNHVLHLKIVGNLFSSPTTTPFVAISSITGMVTSSSSGDWVSYHSLIKGMDMGKQWFAIPAPGSYSNECSEAFDPLNVNTFNIFETFDIVLNNKGEQIGFQSSTELVTPEPASVTLLGVAGAGFAGYLGARRRRTAVAS